LSSRLRSKNVNIYIWETNFTCCFIWVWNVIFLPTVRDDRGSNWQLICQYNDKPATWTWERRPWVTYSMMQDIIWKADSHLACQTIPCFLYRTRMFITVLTKARHRTLSWDTQIRFVPSIPISLRST